MASDEEDDDIEALRKAALATLKPKVQPIQQVISSMSGTTRNQVPEWSEVPDSLDYHGFGDPVPESSPFPALQHVASRSAFGQPAAPEWRPPFINGSHDQRFKLHNLQVAGKPFNPRGHHRSFGDRGRPLYDRGRRPRRGYINARGRDIAQGTPARLPHPPPNILPVLDSASSPTGGNLIVIQPHLSQSNQAHEGPGRKGTPVANSSAKVPASVTQQNSTLQTLKLVLPQDKYHSSNPQQKSQVETVKPDPPSKAKDKFSRYDKSDSEEEEDDWLDHLGEVDDIAEEIDKFLKEDEQMSREDREPASEAVTADELQKIKPGEDNSSVEGLPEVQDEEKEISPPISPVPSDSESLDLDALASGDPVVGDLEDLDALVDKEPDLSHLSDTVRIMSSNNEGDLSAADSTTIDISALGERARKQAPSFSSNSASEIEAEDLQISILEESGDKIVSIVHRDKSLTPEQSSRPTEDGVLHNQQSFSPISNSSSKKGDNVVSNRRESPIRRGNPSLRSRSPLHGGLSPQRYRSPLRDRSPRRRSPSLPQRLSLRSLSPRRRTSPPRRHPPSHHEPLHPRKSAWSPQGRSASPHRMLSLLSIRENKLRHDRIDSRGSAAHQGSRRDEEKFSHGQRPFRCRPYPASRNEKDNWQGSRQSHSSQDKSSGEHSGLRETSGVEKSSPSRKSRDQRREETLNDISKDNKSMENLTPEERAKIEARRMKFHNNDEVKLENAKKTVSLKSIKERSKKTKKSGGDKGDVKESKSNKQTKEGKSASGISLKTLRKNIELKKKKHEEEDEVGTEEENVDIGDLEDDSEDSDSGRAWKQEGNNATARKPYKSDAINRGLTALSRNGFRGRLDRGHARDRSWGTSDRLKPNAHRSSLRRKDMELENEDSEDETVGKRLGSSVIQATQFKVDIPPEKLKIQIQVAPKEKKKKKKSKLDFSHVYSVPAKRQIASDNSEEEEEEAAIVVPKKKVKKKEKKEKKKKKHSKELHSSGDETRKKVEEPKPAHKPSILERLGRKVEIPAVEKEKKKKSKHSRLDDGETEDLDQRIQKMKEKNAAIARRQREIQLDKERYG